MNNDERPSVDTVERPTPTVSRSGLAAVADLTAGEVHELLRLSARMKAEPRNWATARTGATVVCIFEKPSTRTRVAAATAAGRLGMRPQVLSAQEMQLSRGETYGDTARVLSAYADLIVLRTFSHDRIDEVTAAAAVPVVNALSDLHHPTQALADLLTLREHFGRLAGLKLAYIGDANGNIGHSVMEAAALTGMHLVIATPPAYRPNPAVEVRAGALAEKHGSRLEVTDDLEYAAREADVLYPEIWVPMDKNHLHAERTADLSGYRVDSTTMKLANPDAVLLHCLPAFREQEVSSEVLDGPQSLVWEQAANRLFTMQALFHTLTA